MTVTSLRLESQINKKGKGESWISDSIQIFPLFDCGVSVTSLLMLSLDAFLDDVLYLLKL